MTVPTITSPLHAPDREPLKSTNIVRCVRNEVHDDAPLQVKEAWGATEGQQIPHWEIEYECLDTQWPDGNPVKRFFSSILIDPRTGKQLDNEQPYFTVAQAFAGLGITVFPNDPQYNEAEVVGNCFEIENIPVPRSKKKRRFPIPTQVLGRDYEYTGEVRTITPRNDEEANASVGATASGAPVTVDLSTDAAAREKLIAALEGVDRDNEDAVLDAIRLARISNATLEGKGLLSHVMQGTLFTTLDSLS